MLKELRVRDLALVAECRVRFGSGLNLLTGETGSGKSLIVDALSLTLGARGGADQVRHGAERATVEGAFESGGAAIVLQRELGKRSTARIDGRPASPGQLRELGRNLVALHGQHEHHALLDSDTQTELLDGYAGALEMRAAVAASHSMWVEAGNKVRDLEQLRSRGQREHEYMRWQLEELSAADPRPGEDEQLSAERAAARHAARLAELGQQAIDALREDGVARAAAAIRTAAGLDPRLGEQASRLELLAEESSDAAADLRRYGDVLDPDPGRLEAVESRLAVLDGIKRKYGGTLEAAIDERRRLELQIGATQDLEGAVATALAERDRCRADLEAAAGRLTAAREQAARRMQKAVASELAGLRLEGARFEIALRSAAEIAPTGAEGAEMMFSANPGEPLQPLARVASGGELARVMLAIKTVGADADRLPTLVFDEVDAGIGGEAAVQVGLRLRALGSRHQVLVVTHLAQIAAFADHHLLVEKSPGPDGRNVVSVRELESSDERARELARMMSGGVTAKAVARAHELLEESRK
ncbi:MAG TPA: DNA repair protein RecN [Candidatus Dormibacteraeota bacterium]|nr:DNA repair protein RecN [Candidatus Dormibacteraeota bacterium]